MKVFAVATLAMLTGCTAMDRITTAGDPAAVRERELTRRYAFCMKQTLGPFAAFASPTSRQNASETCSKTMQASTATP